MITTDRTIMIVWFTPSRIVGLASGSWTLRSSCHEVEPYASPATHRAIFVVPAGHYVLLGDNRHASSDSRSWRHPYVSRLEIVGVLVRFLPSGLRGSSSLQ